MVWNPKIRLYTSFGLLLEHQMVFSKNLKLIVCGSAASWMLDNLVYAKGGLHNRLTASFPIRPFTLQETEEYLIKRV